MSGSDFLGDMSGVALISELPSYLTIITFNTNWTLGIHSGRR